MVGGKQSVLPTHFPLPLPAWDDTTTPFQPPWGHAYSSLVAVLGWVLLRPGWNNLVCPSMGCSLLVVLCYVGAGTLLMLLACCWFLRRLYHRRVTNHCCASASSESHLCVSMGILVITVAFSLPALASCFAHLMPQSCFQSLSQQLRCGSPAGFA